MENRLGHSIPQQAKTVVTGSRSIHGFTVIELVAVILIGGILGGVVFSRYMGSSAFNELAARDGLLTAIRISQQAALGRSDVSFEINKVGEDWHFVAKTGFDTINTVTVSASGVELETGLPDSTVDSCEVGGSFNTPVENFALKFDSQGNLATFTNDIIGPQAMSASFNGVRICLNDKIANSICVSPAGYAYEGDCEE